MDNTEALAIVTGDVHGLKDDATRLVHFVMAARRLAAENARLTAELDAGQVTYEVWQDDMPVAESDDMGDASHYAAMYAQDGPVEVFRKRTTRERIAAIAGAAK